MLNDPVLMRAMQSRRDVELNGVEIRRRTWRTQAALLLSVAFAAGWLAGTLL
jgi:hypothetical protein